MHGERAQGHTIMEHDHSGTPALADIWAIPVAKGFSVFPLKPNRKNPTGPWKQWQTEHAAPELVAHWAGNQALNVGIATGALSGCIVIDLDNDDAVARAYARGLPDTLTARTPRGLHVYLRHPGGRIRNAASIEPGIDLRGDGGFVVAPGSRFVPTPDEAADGKREGGYAWIDASVPLADAPDWTYAAHRSERGDRTASEAAAYRGPSAYGAAALDRELATLTDAPHGKRNEQINASAFAIGQLVAGGWLDELPTLEALELAVEKVGSDPAKDHDTLERAFAAGMAAPRVLHDPEAAFGSAPPIAPVYLSREAQRAENKRIAYEDPCADALPAVMTLTEMHARLVYIGQTAAIADRETGRIRQQEKAHGEYAASKFEFVDDSGKPKSMPALKAWVASPARVTVDVLTWAPGEPVICQPPEAVDGATRAYNSWRGFAPINPPADWRERVQPFIDHLAYLVPEPAELKRFTQWLAHILQRPHELPHTAMLMVAEQTGIGRNLLAAMLVRALRGHVAAGVQLGELLDGAFNGRLSKRLLAIVDEVREGMGEKRYVRGERLKSLITEEHRLINPKYGTQSIERNCCRWLMFSNHRDALPFDHSDRRVMVIENPRTRKPPQYYARLYSMLDDAAFVAAVRQYLATYDLAGFNAGEHAPMNVAKAQALDAMMSDVERAVMDFRDTCRTELTTRAAVQMHVAAECPGKPVNDAHLTHAIRRAGMILTGARRKLSCGRTSMIIVRGDWTPELVASASTEALERALAA